MQVWFLQRRLSIIESLHPDLDPAADGVSVGRCCSANSGKAWKTDCIHIQEIRTWKWGFRFWGWSSQGFLEGTIRVSTAEKKIHWPLDWHGSVSHGRTWGWQLFVVVDSCPPSRSCRANIPVRQAESHCSTSGCLVHVQWVCWMVQPATSIQQKKEKRQKETHLMYSYVIPFSWIHLGSCQCIFEAQKAIGPDLKEKVNRWWIFCFMIEQKKCRLQNLVFSLFFIPSWISSVSHDLWHQFQEMAATIIL